MLFQIKSLEYSVIQSIHDEFFPLAYMKLLKYFKTFVFNIYWLQLKYIKINKIYKEWICKQEGIGIYNTR